MSKTILQKFRSIAILMQILKQTIFELHSPLNLKFRIKTLNEEIKPVIAGCQEIEFRVESSFVAVSVVFGLLGF